MIQFPSSLFQGLKENNKGGVMILTAFCLMPFLLMIGLAVDTSIGLEQKRKLQMAADTAAKAAVFDGNGVSDTITQRAQRIFAANTVNMKNITGPTINYNSQTGAVTVAASIVVPTTFMALGGISSRTYNAAATATPPSNLAEVAIVYEVSKRFASNSFHQNICTALINFVNSLPSNVMVSITPIATDFILNPTNTVASNLFGHLDPTANDELPDPAYYPLSSNFTWTPENYNYVGSLYYTNNSFATFTSYKSPAPTICPGGYPACPPTMWPLKCPVSSKTSCSQIYTYISNVSLPILPLTLNKTLVVNYLTTLKNYTAKTDGFFPSFLSWGWRSIDPGWNDFWMVNSNSTDQTRSIGKYPKAYGGKQKSMILIFNGAAYWDEYEGDVDGYYINPCGDATKVSGGLNHWWMTSYGLVSVPTDYTASAIDITCENYAYKPMDKVLGLALTDNTNYRGTATSTSYKQSILAAVNSKFFRICNNIKAQGVDVYLLAGNSTSTLSPCCNSSSNAYTITNTSGSLSTAFNAVKSSIVTKIQ